MRLMMVSYWASARFMSSAMHVWLASIMPLTLCLVSTYGDLRESAT